MKKCERFESWAQSVGLSLEIDDRYQDYKNSSTLDACIAWTAALEYKQQKGGNCPERKKPGGCQLHNLHCGYPKCDQKP